MSYPAPTLHVEPTGGLGELFIRVEGEQRPISILVTPDNPVEGGEWVEHIRLPLPGLYRVSGFGNMIWYTITASHVNSGGIAISPAAQVVKSRPEFPLLQRAVDLISEDSQTYVEGRTNTFRGRIKAWPVRGMDDGAIFLYRRELFGTGAATRDVFIAVCKPGDLDYPVGDVGDDAFYRLDYVDLIDRAFDHRNEVWSAITEDVDELMSALELQEVFSAGDVE